jgi:hypothetical protein
MFFIELADRLIIINTIKRSRIYSFELYFEALTYLVGELVDNLGCLLRPCTLITLTESHVTYYQEYVPK